jgi:hypothetical protein
LRISLLRGGRQLGARRFEILLQRRFRQLSLGIGFRSLILTLSGQSQSRRGIVLAWKRRLCSLPDAGELIGRIVEIAEDANIRKNFDLKRGRTLDDGLVLFANLDPLAYRPNISRHVLEEVIHFAVFFLE